jgi:hypothetical protein
MHTPPLFARDHLPQLSEKNLVAAFSQTLVEVGNLDQQHALPRMEREIRALLDHAAYCRAIAAETTHEQAVRRLRDIAIEYERRAQSLATCRNLSK